MQQQFVHLRVHSEYSLIDGMVRVPDLMKALPSKGMCAVAVTDYCNLFAAVKCFKAAVDNGIKPILGADLACCQRESPKKTSSMIMLCQNDEGYLNLTRIISKAYLEGQYHGEPRVYFDWLAEHADGLIVLSGGCAGDIGQAILSDDIDGAIKLAGHWQEVFPGRFYLEIQRTGKADEARYNEKIIEIADSLSLPLVATNNVCFINQDDHEAHDARVCIHDGVSLDDPRRNKSYSKEQYLRSAEQMVQLFSDLPQAVQNTVEISKRCSMKLMLGESYLPKFPTPDGVSVEDFLSQLSKKGLEARLQRLFRDKGDEEMKAERRAYDERLKIELDVINSMGFPGYFLIVADFIQWAKDNEVPVGPGRGSGAGSLVAYALNITDINPLEYELLFERFLNPERVSMPDFDIDFCMEGRDRVIDYVARQYGRDSVSQIITFGTMAAKAVVRDVGRVLGHPYGFVDKLAKLIPFELGITLTKALEQEEVLKSRYEDEEEVKGLIDLALKLEGITRNAGKHAGGVVIAPSKLTDFTAIYCEEGSTQIVSQFDKDDVESVGLVKFDFLGLKTLTIINWSLRIINEQRKKAGEPLIDISEIPIDDAKTFDLLKECNTTAVFQLESRGMKDLIKRLGPDCFEEIIALVALFRPGPLQSGMVDDFIDRKHGRAKVEYPHPDLEPILQPTYGVILYQEQVMQIAQVLAKYTLGGADLLRRAMGKKKPEEMAKQREIFNEGAQGRGVDGDVAMRIFDLMEKFAGYGFNKSHSAAYALVAYQTAWLKAHYPSAFMAAVLSADMDNTDKVVIFLDDCKKLKIVVKPPNINQSKYKFTVGDNNEIIYGLGAIKGVGEAAIQNIVSEYEENGHYYGLFNLCHRVDLRRVNRRVLEALIKSGACDVWDVERSILLASVDNALKGGAQQQSKNNTGQQDLFSLFDENICQEIYVFADTLPDNVRLSAEKATLGYYLTGHPADIYCNELGVFSTSIAKLNPNTSKRSITCGIIVGIRKILTKRGKKLAIITIEDASAKIDVVVFGEIFEPKEEILASGQLLVVDGEVAHDDFNGGVKLTAATLYSLEEARTKFAKCLCIKLCREDQHKLASLQACLKKYPGQCVVQINYSNDKAKGRLSLGAEWRVLPSEELINSLTQIFDLDKVEIKY